ncbi:heme lyase CcmF/NrfE family subunit [Tepidiphilus margaritifer]|uniref:heme lyase CcmF/NrfE family subunit n=1 Tax=Tepidiphilus margaritifer TaxID=203471 RepID=UPI0003FC5A7D|nr:heme lyase CcmF/NrfE family subunit [Tepidiphilus margaritifer]
MIPEMGQFALALAWALALVQAVLGLAGAARGSAGAMAAARRAALAQCAALVLAYACLTASFLRIDFSVLLVAANSSTRTPWFYRLTGVWGNHEGSMLLWALSLSLWQAAVAAFSRSLTESFRARVLGVLGAVSVGFLAFLVLTSNPFERLVPMPAEGRDLNPMLQDPGMIIHPPLLYMGYVGMAVAFAFAIAALLSGRMDAAWARWSRPWTLVAWVFLTLGILVGSAWAYYELGWGGWWFWDPVENASLMPWLLGTALLHSLIVTEKRGAFRSWTVLLAIGAFSLSLLGTFLVRSGVITSVHAFASDPKRGVFILGLLALTVGVSLLLFAWRAPRLSGGGAFAPVSREGSLLVNNVLMASAAGAVLLGTIYPMVIDALHAGKISVGPPYFETVFVPLMVPAVVLMALAPFLRWKRDALARVLRRVWPELIGALLIAALGVWAMNHVTFGAFLGIALTAWVVLASLRLLVDRLRQGGAVGLAARLRGIPGSWWGMWLSHLGVGVFILGVTLVGALEQRLDVKMMPGEAAELAGYRFVLRGVSEVPGPNYTAQRGELEVWREGRMLTVLAPEKRAYFRSAMPMTESAIDWGVFRDVYVSLGDPTGDGGWVVLLFYKPFISWIWFGAIAIAVGGLAAALDRRYRRLARRMASVPLPEALPEPAAEAVR